MKYVTITLKGFGSYVQPLDEIHNAIDGELDGLMESGDEITLTFKASNITDEQYKALPDFAGH